MFRNKNESQPDASETVILLLIYDLSMKSVLSYKNWVNQVFQQYEL